MWQVPRVVVPLRREEQLGQAKRLWMEMEEFDWETSDVFFNCPACGNDVDGYTELPVVFEGKDADEFPIVVTCSSCDEEFDGIVSADWDNCQIQFDGYPDVEVDANPVRGDVHQYDDWEHEPDWDTYLDVSEPFRIFSETRGQLTTLLAKMEGPTLLPHANELFKMMLVQAVTSLEAYLSDTLISHVMQDNAAQLRLINSKRLGLCELKFGLKEAFGEEHFATKALSKYLANNISYHNLRRVQPYFEVGLQTPFRFEADELELIHAGIQMRHDCVHRNGKPLGSDEYHEIEQDFLSRLMDAIQNFVTRIEDDLAKRAGNETKTPFLRRF